MIDIHSHILPRIDDGAKDIDTTLNMLQIAIDNGTAKIVATPHYRTGYFENTYEDVKKAVDEVNSVIIDKAMDIQVVIGQEIFLDNHTMGNYKKEVVGCIGNTEYMLIELSMDVLPKNAIDIIYELKLKGIRPIIAHPERYNYIIEKPSIINDFIEEGCLFQINGGSITGLFGKKVQKTSEVLIQHGVCDFIASDAHSTGRRCPGINEAFKVLESLNRDLAKSVVNNGQVLLNNEKIHLNAQKIKEKKSLFSFFKR
ncbi:tyrosine-protein phosphatase [Clostridium magnum]|uniref:protein-tyrosine-phosphatase n=1 Tax=Clostridium magnum DSM 2767 TaxID=1121326 RepID=A0A162RCM3_9CLOT|nr:CpsB/CapC family capsule biosynthesis tyrosine phosphatase [Clostridium magnum]KZL89714.1 tyrosine-protein phosphatase YwqE [Clostridium magnum DSM 2767]SHH64606.1 protein-tyrosine phosphatase [Clostridium magnum DSM 2767]